MKSKIPLVFVVSLLLAMLIQGQGRSEPSERKTGDTATFALPGGATIEMVWIEPGTFMMGSPEDEPGRSGSEGPQHQVTITRGFWLGKYEITQGQWESVMGTRPWEGQTWGDYIRHREGPEYPVVWVSFKDLRAFVLLLNQAEEKEVYRLPTEAEWEYACRAGTTTAWSFGDDEAQLGEYAWYKDNATLRGEMYAHVVGRKRPNPWGLYDIHGNMWELCYRAGDYTVDSQTNPVGPFVDCNIRGGSFHSEARFLRSALRGTYSQDKRSYEAGARLLRQAAILKGDINQDEMIDVRDVILCLRIVAGMSLPAGHTTPTEQEAWAADIDGDGKVTSGDALQILSLAVERVLRQEP